MFRAIFKTLKQLVHVFIDGCVSFIGKFYSANNSLTIFSQALFDFVSFLPFLLITISMLKLL